MRTSDQPSYDDLEYPLEVTIEGIDQQNAQAAWAKLAEETHYIDQTLRGPKHTFYCTNDSPDPSKAGYFIGIFAPGSDPNKDASLVDLFLVQNEDGTLSVIQPNVNAELGETSLLAQEIDPFLDQIANSTRKHSEEG